MNPRTLKPARFTGEWLIDRAKAPDLTLEAPREAYTEFPGFLDPLDNPGQYGRWVTPYFTRAQAQAYTDWQNAQPADLELGMGYFDEDRDAFIFWDGDNGERVFEGDDFSVGKLYRFTDWIWEVAE